MKKPPLLPQQPAVSVIMPLYNMAEWVEESIASVQAQTFKNWELVIIDDCSKDDTRAIVKKLMKDDPRIRLIEQKANGGPIIARNTGLENAKGRFIAFLDGDDLWLPEKLALQIPALENSPHGLCCSSYAIMNHQGERTGRTRQVAARTYSLHDILTNNVIGCLTAVLDTSKTGPIRLPGTHTVAEDYALWLKVLSQGVTAVGLSQTLAVYRLTKNSYSSRKLHAAKGVWKIFRHSQMLPWWLAAWYFVGYAVRRAPRLLERI